MVSKSYQVQETDVAFDDKEIPLGLNSAQLHFLHKGNRN